MWWYLCVVVWDSCCYVNIFIISVIIIITLWNIGLAAYFTSISNSRVRGRLLRKQVDAHHVSDRQTDIGSLSRVRSTDQRKVSRRRHRCLRRRATGEDCTRYLSGHTGLSEYAMRQDGGTGLSHAPVFSELTELRMKWPSLRPKN